MVLISAISGVPAEAALLQMSEVSMEHWAEFFQMLLHHLQVRSQALATSCNFIDKVVRAAEKISAKGVNNSFH